MLRSSCGSPRSLRKLSKAMAALSLSTAVLLGGCRAEKEEDDALRLMVGTDLHYISPELFDGGELFRMMIEGGDGKMTEYSEEAADALVEKALQIHPDALVLCGDLTFNGELKSLTDLKEKLLRITAEGIPVCVIPGNHDIAYPMARRYEGYMAYETENISSDQFREIMGCFGYDQAVSKDTASFSYLYRLDEKTYLLFLDTNTEEAPGSAATATLQWLDEALAVTKGSYVISVTHQNLIPQSATMSQGFTVYNRDVVLKILRKHNVQLNFSGHSHIQHTAAEDGFTDICTGSMSVAPMRYAAVAIKDGEVTYAKQELGVLKEESVKRFRSLTERSVAESLDADTIPADVLARMAAFAADINLAYFSGDMPAREEITAAEDWQLWEQYGSDTFWYFYFNTMAGE